MHSKIDLYTVMERKDAPNITWILKNGSAAILINSKGDHVAYNAPLITETMLKYLHNYKTLYKNITMVELIIKYPGIISI